MAIDLGDRYPGQTDVGVSGYPHGRAKNVVTPGDGTGTPWERDIPNDIYGFLHGLLVSANIAPSGTPDTATVSQYRAALKALTRRNGITATLTGSGIAAGSTFALTPELETDDSGFVYSEVGGDDFILAPQQGLYLVALTLRVQCTSVTDGIEVQARATTGAQFLNIGGVRYNTNPVTPINMSGSRIMAIGPAVPLAVVAQATGGGSLTVLDGRISIARVSAAPSGGETGW
jgi:hypothetical protein